MPRECYNITRKISKRSGKYSSTIRPLHKKKIGLVCTSLAPTIGPSTLATYHTDEAPHPTAVIQIAGRFPVFFLLNIKNMGHKTLKLMIVIRKNLRMHFAKDIVGYICQNTCDNNSIYCDFNDKFRRFVIRTKCRSKFMHLISPTHPYILVRTAATIPESVVRNSPISIQPTHIYL